MFREIIVILRDAISRAKLQRMIFSTTEKSICYECYNFTAAHQDDKHEWRNVEHQTPFLNGFTLNLFFGYTLCYAWESFLILPHSSSRPHNWITNYKWENDFNFKKHQTSPNNYCFGKMSSKWMKFLHIWVAWM